MVHQKRTDKIKFLISNCGIKGPHWKMNNVSIISHAQLTFSNRNNSSKLTIETLEKGVEYVQSEQKKTQERRH